MEETRSFGYVCPKCGKAVVARRSKFALSAAAVRMECPKCGESALEVQTDGVRFRLWVPCGLCGGVHQAECSAQELLEGRGIALACPETKQLCCYAGEYGIRIHRDAADLTCRACGGRLRLPAATDEDLDQLCCRMTLEIPGRKDGV